MQPLLKKRIEGARARAQIRQAWYGMDPQPGAPQGLDPANAEIFHIVRPRDRELAMLYAEHARWAERETVKALNLASLDASSASSAASRANKAAMDAMRQKDFDFRVYEEQPLPGEPWFARPTKSSGSHGQLKRALPPGGVNLDHLAAWFKKYPGPPGTYAPNRSMRQEQFQQRMAICPPAVALPTCSQRGPALSTVRRRRHAELEAFW